MLSEWNAMAMHLGAMYFFMLNTCLGEYERGERWRTLPAVVDVLMLLLDDNLLAVHDVETVVFSAVLRELAGVVGALDCAADRHFGDLDVHTFVPGKARAQFLLL